MKIITRGRVPEERTYRFECTHCRTVFEAIQRECQYISDQRDGDCMRYNCPVCTRACYASVK